MLRMSNANKLLALIWMGVGSAILSSLFSGIINMITRIFDKVSFIEQELLNLNNKSNKSSTNENGN